jgi:hypothetical protein
MFAYWWTATRTYLLYLGGEGFLLTLSTIGIPHGALLESDVLSKSSVSSDFKRTPCICLLARTIRVGEVLNAAVEWGLPRGLKVG